MDDTFNFRNPQNGEVVYMHQEGKRRRLANEKYRVLSQILSGKKDVDVTVSPQIFEALNRERMEFEELLKLHPDQTKETIEAVKEDRERYPDGKYWNRKTKAWWGCLGHIPPCIYYSRPQEYWRDKRLLREFYNMFPKFRLSTKRL